jgi:hypothetical protein
MGVYEREAALWSSLNSRVTRIEGKLDLLLRLFQQSGVVVIALSLILPSATALS